MNFYVNKILKDQKITDFLEERGITPVRTSSDKLFYLCPVHSGDKVPSFVVYPVGHKGREYQTYHCFSCHSGINLINLKSDLDGISTKKAVSHFLKDIEIEFKEAEDAILDSIMNEKEEIEETKDIESILLMINHVCKRHLSICDDDAEIDFFENFFKNVDRVARSRDIETLEGILEILMEKGGLDKKVEEYDKRQEDRDVSSMAWRL
jgi:hypothetical protein